MTLKELYEKGKDAVYEIVEDYLHTDPKFRLVYDFEDYLQEIVTTCPKCGEINKRDNMTYHAWDVGGTEELICESCRNDEEM